MLDTGQWRWCWLRVKAWVVFVKCYDRTAQWRKSTMEPMALHLLHCTKCTISTNCTALLALTALTATLISRSAAAGAGDQVLILLKVTSQHHFTSSQPTRPEGKQPREVFVIEVKHWLQSLVISYSSTKREWTILCQEIWSWNWQNVNNVNSDQREIEKQNHCFKKTIFHPQ